jgi:uncharacterized protein
MKIYVEEKKIIDNAKIAKSFFDRTLGLMFKKNIDFNSGLLIKDCNWIHTFFMRFPIDVIYIDKNNKIIDIQKNLKPWTFAKPRFKSKHVLELKGGFLDKFSVKVKEELKCIV